MRILDFSMQFMDFSILISWMGLEGCSIVVLGEIYNFVPKKYVL
ncbi:MAG: hypothetical protein ACTSR8_15180 [Promethearchaeota archaeon]